MAYNFQLQVHSPRL